MNKVLITGGAGFIGFHLANRLLKQGHSVDILDNFARQNMDEELETLISRENVNFLKKDLTNSSTWDELPLNHYDIVYHFAAINGTENFYKRPVDVLKVGCLSTIYLLDWASSQEKKPKLIYSSSSEIYAATLKILGDDFPIPTPETISPSIEDVKNVRWSYAGGKLIGEIAFFCYAETHGISDFNIIRFHNIYGPRMGDKHVISQFSERLLREENPFVMYGGDQTRTFCYIEDALNAIEKVTQNSDFIGEIVHIGNDDEEIEIKSLAEMLFKINDRRVEFKFLPSPEGSVQRRCPNIDKIKKMGYCKTVSLVEGLKTTFDWYKANLTRIDG